VFIKKLAQAFSENKIPYSIVGGYALVLHGAVRGTLDVDMVTQLTLKNLKKLESVLKSLGLECRQPVSAHDIFNFREEYIKNRNMIAWSFFNPMNPSELVDIIITIDLNEIGIEKKKLQDITLPVIDKKSLIEMKKKAGRPQDKIDVKALETLK
jgi:hypothetical protein